MSIEFDSIDSAEPAKRSGRSRRVAAGIGAAMLVAAAGGVGFGIGRSVGDNEQVATPAAQSDEAAEDVADLASPEPASTDPVPADAAENEPVVPEPRTEPATTDLALADEAPASGAEIISSGGVGYSVYGDQPMEVIFDRSTDSGLTVRAYLGDLWNVGLDDGYYGPGDWQPSAWCFESGQVRLAIAGTDLIDVGSVGWYIEPYEGRAVSWVTMGRVDGNPHRVVFVQTPPETTMVTATFGDGSVDSVAPQDQVAVLVVPGAPATIEHDEGDFVWLEEMPDFVVSFESGAETFDVDPQGVGTWGDPEFQASCSPPPPPLPDPGEQPADADLAGEEIASLMEAIYGEGDDLEDATAFIDDPTGVAEAREEVAQGSLEESAASAEAIVEEVVFTAPNEAWFRYRLETINGTFGERYGIAVFVDDVWKITRDTICQDLSLAGGSCGDGWQVIRPPGYEYEEPIFLDGIEATEADVPAATVYVEE